MKAKYLTRNSISETAWAEKTRQNENGDGDWTATCNEEDHITPHGSLSVLWPSVLFTFLLFTSLFLLETRSLMASLGFNLICLSSRKLKGWFWWGGWLITVGGGESRVAWEAEPRGTGRYGIRNTERHVCLVVVGGGGGGKVGDDASHDHLRAQLGIQPMFVNQNKYKKKKRKPEYIGINQCPQWWITVGNY